MSLIDNQEDHRLGHGVDEKPRPQNAAYLVLSEAERIDGFVRPYRDAYRHNACGVVTTMAQSLAETYAKYPEFYHATYCTGCRMHKPVAEFVWDKDGQVVGS
jgi:NADH:ubiquinone oxidoreductase subunit E